MPPVDTPPASAPPADPPATTQTAASPTSADVIAELNASAPIGQQSWNGLNCYGRVGNYNALGDDAVHGAPLADGSTLRFGRTTDPLAPTRRAFLFKVATQDTLFADSRRCEAVAYATPETALPQRQSFWYSVTLLVDEGANSQGDDQLLTQWHTQGYNPLMALYLSQGKLRITVRHSTAPAGTAPVALTPWVDSAPVGRRWMTFVFNARLSPNEADAPFLRVWRDGQLIVDHNGPIGYNSTELPYAKVGFYNWNDRNPWDAATPVRSILVRRAATLRDASNQFSESTVRTWAERE
jgi:hypothetical protein